MFTWLRTTIPAILATYTRSGKWRAVRARHLELNPTCAACGTDEDVEVHHILPVHEAIRLGRPEMELDKTNLLTLCGGLRNCHWAIGHGYDWKAWRPSARALAHALLSSKVER